MGIPGLQRRGGGNSGDRLGSFVAVTPLLVLGLAVFVVVLNIRHYSSMCGSESARDEALSRAAMERKVQALENEVLQNSIFLSRLLQGLDRAFHATEKLSVEHLRNLAMTEAAEIGQRRAAKPPPPFPAHARAGIESSVESETLHELIHSSLETALNKGGAGGTKVANADQGWDWGSQSAIEDDWLGQRVIEAGPYVDIPSDPERTRQCLEWYTKHNVVPGFDWGTLPLQDQEKWKAYSCDGVHESAAASVNLKETPEKDQSGGG